MAIYLVVVISSEVDGDKGEPYDARGVHGEADVLGLVKVLRDFARFECVEGAEDDEEHVVEEGHDERQVAYSAGQNGREGLRMDLFRPGLLHHKPHQTATQLNRSQACAFMYFFLYSLPVYIFSY